LVTKFAMMALSVMATVAAQTVKLSKWVMNALDGV